MRKLLVGALATLSVALLVPALAGAGIIASNVQQGNDYGFRGAVVNYTLPTTADEGALIGTPSCDPVPGSFFNVGTAAVNCLGLVSGGQTCIPFLGCFPNPPVIVGGGFNVTVNLTQCSLVGDAVANDLDGTASADWICGLGGADVIGGAGGADTLVGGGGGDRITGGGAKDKVLAGAGGDTVRVKDGNRDTVNCGTGRDLVVVDGRDVVNSNCERVRRG